MHTRTFGKTGMEITPIGLGAWAIGGGNWQFGWGSQDDNESIATIHRAIDLGVNWIDTAAVYGLGHAEEIVGKALQGRGEKPYIFTKCERTWTERREIVPSLKAASIQREVEDSLRRLDVDVIDLYQIHWPQPEEDIEEGWSTLVKLKEQGKVRAIGVSNFSVEQMERCKKYGPVETLQPPYSLLNRDAERDLLPYCERENIGVIVYSPMSSGLLSGRMTKERVAQMPDDDWRKNSPDFQSPRLERNLELAKMLTEDIGFPHNVGAGVVAIAWVLSNPAVTGAIVGARHPNQIEDLLPAAELRLSELELDQIEQFMQKHPVQV
ncbi:aldo/keto reductase [Ktedonobacter racemifer]|uniref:Aldo/keto reductase n=1 Tax=Ktedonobacter racemifer DSM 44963 TaxID=485913 RepID=D6TDW3_KTERA|nr:aldo/keto reductase [Ktedonobacter racemifer]EFH90245.1 aldo/keto reductase [Ktedonobacter racemifer DSM 44963]